MGAVLALGLSAARRERANRLFALTLAAVTLVVPLRELSILFGVVLGGQFLAEGHTWTRALAAVTIVAGVAAISSG